MWTLNGVLLKQVVFNNESATGWQEFYLIHRLPLPPTTTYVASYHSPTGYYAQTDPYFTSAVVNGPLTAIAKQTRMARMVFINFHPSPYSLT
ncbi:MAG: DUF4082 domain-containing protein [Bacteroidota bacterium]